MDGYRLPAIKHKTGTEVPRSLFQPNQALYLSGYLIHVFIINDYMSFLLLLNYVALFKNVYISSRSV